MELGYVGLGEVHVVPHVCVSHVCMYMYVLETPNGAEWNWVRRGWVMGQGFEDRIWLSPT